MAKKDRWFLPTNTNNMRMMIAQGLLIGPDGFFKKEKYYSDALELSPGWISLYKNKIPSSILEKTVSERDSLTACVIEIELNTINGVAKILKNNEIVDIGIEDIANEVVDVLYILAPLPISCVSKIIFKDENDKKEFEADAKIKSNVILEGLNLKSTKTDQKLFRPESISTDCSIEKITLPYSEIDYKRVYSFGGLLATLFYFAKNGNKSTEIYHLICDLNDLTDSKENDIGLIYEYFKTLEISTEISLKKQMYIGLIDRAIKNNDFKDDIIDFLESDAWDEKTLERTQSIAKRLRAFETNSDKTVSEYFKEAKTQLEKILLMLFLREDSDALADFKNDLLSEEDYIQFAMMFGIRDKFIKAPKFIREFDGLQNFISYKMAEYAHKQVNSNIQLKAPRKPLTLLDMIKNNEFVKWFSKQLKIENCMKTKIIVPKGAYEVRVGSSGLEIIFDGIVKPPIAELIEEKYFEFMSKHNVTVTEYHKYIKKYEQVK